MRRSRHRMTGFCPLPKKARTTCLWPFPSAILTFLSTHLRYTNKSPKLFQGNRILMRLTDDDERARRLLADFLNNPTVGSIYTQFLEHQARRAEQIQHELRRHIAQLPQETYSDRHAIALFVSALMDALDLSIAAPRDGRPCTVRASTHHYGSSRYRLKLRDGGTEESDYAGSLTRLDEVLVVPRPMIDLLRGPRNRTRSLR